MTEYRLHCVPVGPVGTRTGEELPKDRGTANVKNADLLVKAKIAQGCRFLAANPEHDLVQVAHLRVTRHAPGCGQVPFNLTVNRDSEPYRHHERIMRLLAPSASGTNR